MPTFEQLLSFFLSYFYYPNISGPMLALGIILPIIFGAAWFACYKPPYSSVLQKHWLWIVLIISPFFSLAALAFIQVPLQSWTGVILLDISSSETLTNLIAFSAIPIALISGLVIEGAKMVPAVIYWFVNNKEISAKNGLFVGAAAGALFGIFEAQWLLNSSFIQGWNVDLIQSIGIFTTFSPFWERFFVVALHISTSALAGYGLAKGKGWQFYLLAAALHTVLEYLFILVKAGIIEFTFGEVLIAIWAILVSATAIWVRRSKISPETA